MKHKHTFRLFEGICSVKGCDVNRTMAQIEELEVTQLPREGDYVKFSATKWANFKKALSELKAE